VDFFKLSKIPPKIGDCVALGGFCIFKSTNKNVHLLNLTYFCKNQGEHGYSYHTILREEQRSFSNWINSNLGGFSELKHLLPLKNDGADLYEKINDGILLW